MWNNCIILLLKAASGDFIPRLKEPKYFSSIENFPHKGVGDISVDRYAIKSFNQYKKLFQQIKNKRVERLVQIQFIFIKNSRSYFVYFRRYTNNHYVKKSS